MLLIYEIVLNISTLFHHSNWGLPEKLDRILRWIIVTPNMHRVHHSVIVAESDSNYSTTLSIWDRMLGTLVQSDQPQIIKLGVKKYLTDSWQNFIKMLETPFLKGDKK